MCMFFLKCLSYSHTIGTTLLTVSATDADGRDNAIKYSFDTDSGNDTSIFTIDEDTGDIRVSSALPILNQNQHVSFYLYLLLLSLSPLAAVFMITIIMYCLLLVNILHV